MWRWLMSILLRFRHRSRLLGGGALRASGGRLKGLLRQFQMTGALLAPMGRLRGLLTMQSAVKVQLAGRIRAGVARLSGQAYAFGSGGIATKLAVTTQPAGVVNGIAFATQPVVRLQDVGSANVVESGVIVTAYLSSGTGILSGTTQVATDSVGRATFTNLTYTGTGSFTISFHALMTSVQSIWSDDVETDRSSSYFEVETDGGVFGRASVDGSMQWRGQYSTGGSQSWGSLKLGMGRMPSGGGFTAVGPTNVDWGEVTMECDMYHSTNSLLDDQDKFARMTVFTAGDWSQACIAHWWSNGTTHMEMDPATLVSGSTVLSSGYNDFANMTFLGLTPCSTTVFGGAASPATLSRRYRCVMRLNDPGQSNGIQQMYINGVLDGQVTGLNFMGTYTGYGINTVMWENYRTGGSGKNHNRMFDNLSVVGRARAIVASNPLSVSTVASATVTGTASSGWYEAEVVAGGDTIVLTLSNEAFVAAGTAFDAQRQSIIDGIVASTSPANGWNAVRSSIPVTAVVRSANTQVTITLPALAAYSVTANQTLTVTLPASALVAGQSIVATPALTITEGAVPSSANPNEPAGMTVGFDEPWYTVPTSASSGPAWFTEIHPDRVSIITDATAPSADKQCLQLFFPAGATGGVEPMVIGWNETNHWPANTGTLYLRMQVKMSSNWSDNGNGIIKFCWVRTAASGTNHYIPLNAADAPAGGFRTGLCYQGGYLGGADDDNFEPTSHPVNTWYDVEYLFYQGTSMTAANGTIDVWVDGVHVLSEANKRYAANGQPLGWTWFQIAPTFGGGSNPVPHDQYVWIDHIYSSVK